MKFFLYNKEHPYQASPFAVLADGIDCNYRDSDSIPFVITLGGRVCFGEPGSEHHEILTHIGETQSRAEGRFWRRSGALTFWDETHDITNENVKLVTNALHDRLGVGMSDIRMFLDCQYDRNKDVVGYGLIIELTPDEYLSMKVPFGQNMQYFWNLYKKKVKLSGRDDKVAGNGMLSRDMWRHYQNVGEGKVSKVVISENRLREIIASVIMEHLNERGTNMGSLYHFTDINALAKILKTGHLSTGSHQKDKRNGKSFISFTRHKSSMEGFAFPRACDVRIEVDGNKLNSVHNATVYPFEYYSPGRKYNKEVYGGVESAKELYRRGMKNYSHGEYDYMHQAEESFETHDRFVPIYRIAIEIDVLVPFNFFERYKKWDHQTRSEWTARIFSIVSTGHVLLGKTYVYQNTRDFNLQTQNRIPIREFWEKLRTLADKISMEEYRGTAEE